jgi:hypothetical protein
LSWSWAIWYFSIYKILFNIKKLMMHVVHVNAPRLCYLDYVFYVFQWSNTSLSGNIWIFTTTPLHSTTVWPMPFWFGTDDFFFFFLSPQFLCMDLQGLKATPPQFPFLLDLVYVPFISTCSILNHRIEIFFKSQSNMSLTQMIFIWLLFFYFS